MTRRRAARLALAGVVRAGVARAATRASSVSFALRIFERVNELRRLSGAEALQWSAAVALCAEEQSRRKDELRFPGHNDPARGGVAERLRAAGVGWSRCGENVFSERGYDDPVHVAVVSWWYSEGHRENLLNREFTHTGVGVARGEDETFFVTQIFLATPATGRPRLNRQ